MPTHSEAVKTELSGSSLPPLPHVLVELMRVCQDHDASFQDIAAVIAKDAVISSQLISVANSSYYSRQGSVQTIERALLLLGIDALKTMVITASVQQMCSGCQSVSPSYFKSFWRHSLRCGLIARALSRLTGFASPEEAYLIGLLHNIGELLLAVNHSDDYPAMLLQSDRDQNEQESVQYQVNHCQLGRGLAEQWGLNRFAADAIAYHHAPLHEVADAHHLTKLVFLAAELADRPDDEEQGVIELGGVEAAERLFGLSGALVKEITARVATEVKVIAGALGIDLEDDQGQDFERAQSRLGQQFNRRVVNQEVASLFNQGDAEVEVNELIAQAVSIMFGYKHSSLMSFDAEQNALTFDVSEPETGRIVIPLATSQSLIAASAISREVRWSGGTADDESSITLVDRQFMHLCQSHSIICVPVVKAGELLAVLVMGNSGRGSPDAVNLSLLRDFSHHVASLLESRQLAAENSAVNLIQMKEKVRTVIHEVNNPLAIIRNYLEALSNTSDDKQFEIIREEIDRAVQILMRLQDIESESVGQSGQLCVNDEIKSLVSVFEQSICRANNVECELQLSPKLDDVRLPRNQLRQVITNLIKNAVEAMPDGGRVTVTTGVSVGSAKGAQLEIVIADNGPGIPDQVFNHLFKPGYTTKKGSHSGLGLSITHNLIEEIGGSVTCQSSNKGTQFRILLPFQ